ncbi:tubulin/FtsZ family protein [Haloarculaceae archaeon H-GB2-1]|nr:tubulin/FtsZ family protein [Haloarculaceae archaeon H-GB11]MEA5409007.1 tubulin/FtsZ family protein [Haloarculaceae archaeon H-GB2-1]
MGQTDERVKGHGAGADPEIGAEIARQDVHELERALDGVPIHAVDAFLVIAGLGGGTGSGGAPVLASRLREMYEEPVYGLAIFPSEDEGGRASLNAARSVQSFTESTDNLIAFDNDAWRSSGNSLQGGYERTNEEIAKRIATLLAAGEYDGSTVSETAMDSSDVRRTLSTGGISTIAYAQSELNPHTREQKGLLSRFSGNGRTATNGSGGPDPAKKVHGLVRKAVQSRLTCPANILSAERSLIVVSGPPSEFSQKGLRRARQWVERETSSAEVLAGDDPRKNADQLSAAVVLSNVTEVPRIDRLQEQAVSAQDNIAEQEQSREDEIRELITDDEDRLDPI